VLGNLQLTTTKKLKELVGEQRVERVAVQQRKKNVKKLIRTEIQQLRDEKKEAPSEGGERKKKIKKKRGKVLEKRDCWMDFLPLSKNGLLVENNLNLFNKIKIKVNLYFFFS